MKTFPFLLFLGFSGATLAEVDKDALPTVEEGFKINFFVKEPHIINPSSLCFDKHGRLYVGAGPQYRSPKEDSPTDYIKILIDEDGDGVAERVKTFAEGLNCVQSMAWKNDELWVANAPELTVLRDTDGDDVADEYQIIYTGLNNLRHSVHGLNWGPDGWLYFTMGNTWVKPNAPKPIRDLQGIKSDDQTKYPLTKVYSRDTYPKSYHPMNKDEKEGAVFRCRPGGHGLELYARGMRNPWDMCMDSGFNWLATDNDPGAPAERIFMPIRHGHYSMRHPWKFDWMGKHIAVAPSSDLFPGVSGSGTGVAFYTSTHFPEKYRGRHLIADWTNNCIFLYTPKWEGALQVPAEVKRKIVDAGVTQAGDLGYKGAKGRSLFRPTDIEVGPDGALYIAGWGSVYGTEYVPKEKWTPEENAKYQGRVFRLRHNDPLIPLAKWGPAKRKKDIKAWTFDELMEDIGHQVHVWRVNAQDELIRRGAEVRESLASKITSGTLSETAATWSVWALGRIDGASGIHSEMITYSHRAKKLDLNLRVQATRILGENKAEVAVPALISHLEDAEPRIRTAAMQSLDRIGWGNHRKAILDAIAYEDERIAFYTNWQVMRRQLPEEQRRKLLESEQSGIRRMAALGLMEEGDRDLQRRAGELLKESGSSTGKKVPPRAVVTISAGEKNFRESTTILFQASKYRGEGSTSKKEAAPLKVEIRYTLDGSDPKMESARAPGELKISRDATVKAAAFEGKQLASKIESLTVHRISDSEWQDRLFVQKINRDGYDTVDEGLQRGVLAYADDAKETIVAVPDSIAGATQVRTRTEDAGNTDSKFLSFETNLPATLYLAYDSRAKVPPWLQNSFEKTEHVVSTSKGATMVVYRKDAKSGTVILGGNAGAVAMYQVYVSKAGAKKTTIVQAKAALPRANTKRGEEIFFGRGTCFACHQVKGKGVVVGPDLVGIHKRRDMEYVLQSTLQPDAYIVEGFQQTSLAMKDGRTLFGMIQEETALSIKLALLTGERVVVNADNVKKRSDAKNSGMPASFAYTLSPQDVADVTAWIMTLK